MRFTGTRFDFGKLIGERYKVVRKHGETALWEGYCATDQQKVSRSTNHWQREEAGPEVLVKLVKPGLVPTRALRLQLVRKLEPLSELHHPAILRLIEVRALEWPETVMLCEATGTNQLLGQPLGSLLGTRRFTLSEVLKIVTRLASALTYLHDPSRGTALCHGDLRPDTVHWWSGGITLGDIGLGVALRRSLYLSAVGKVSQQELLATEVRRGGPLDRRSDVFGLGALYRYLLALGRDRYWHTLLAQNPGMKDVIERATHEDPEQRYQSIAALIGDLKAVALADEPSHRHPAPGPKISSPPDSAPAQSRPITSQPDSAPAQSHPVPSPPDSAPAQSHPLPSPPDSAPAYPRPLRGGSLTWPSGYQEPAVALNERFPLPSPEVGQSHRNPQPAANIPSPPDSAPGHPRPLPGAPFTWPSVYQKPAGATSQHFLLPSHKFRGPKGKW